jgi:hypothetical protein
MPGGRPATAPGTKLISPRRSSGIAGPRTNAPEPSAGRDAVAELLALQAEYTAWHEAVPETRASTASADALQAIVELDLDALADIVLTQYPSNCLRRHVSE